MVRLTVRVASTLGLVLAVNLLLALSLAVVLEPWLAGVLAGVGVTSTPATITVLTVLAVLLLFVGQLRYTRRELLAEADATVVPDEDGGRTDDEWGLSDRVIRLASQLDMPAPAVAIADSSVPNSLAIGDLGAGTIVVSRGLLDRLDADELEAVLAHELVHLKNRDAVVMTVASFLPALVADDYEPLGRLPTGVSTLLWTGTAIVGYGLASSFLEAPVGSLASIGQFVVAAAVTVVVGGIVLGVLAAAVLGAARSLSRHREFVADRDGARLAGNPAAMASALATLDDRRPRPTTDKRTATRGLCLLPYGFETAAESDEGEFTVETRSHPPTAERIARLKEQTARIERGP